MRILSRVGAAVAVIALTLVAMTGTSSAQQSISVSQTQGLQDGQTVTVNLAGFVPGGNDGQHPNAKLVIAGQGEFSTIPDKLNFEEYASAIEVPIQPDGTGVGELLVYADHGTQQDGYPAQLQHRPLLDRRRPGAVPAPAQLRHRADHVRRSRSCCRAPAPRRRPLRRRRPRLR